MGVLARRRSLLIKLVVIVTTAWFTIAFLLYSENRNDNAIALPLESNINNNNDINRNIIDNRNVIDETFKREEDVLQEPVRKQVDSAVLRPPEDNPGEMGKPVVLPTNLTGKFFLLYYSF